MSESFKNALAADVQHKFDNAERDRMDHESRWAKAYHNYRGKYYKDVHFTDEEKSRVFVKITKTKVLAAYGQLIDILFNAGRLPISIQRTKVPKEEVSTEASLDFEASSPEETMPPEFDLGYAGDGMEVPPGATFDTMPKPGPMPQKMPPEAMGAPQGLPQVSPSPTPQGPVKMDEMDLKAYKMERLIFDQLDSSGANKVVRDALFESCLLGSGIVKGPFNDYKDVNQWEKDETGSRILKQERTRVPKVEFVSVWNFYPDPEASSMEEADWVIQRHKLSKTQMRALKKNPHFDKDAINRCLKDGGNYRSRELEMEVQAEDQVGTFSNRWEVLEYWGYMDADVIRTMDSSLLPDDSDIEIQVNVWVCGGEVIRVMLNPFQPVRIPYMMFHYEKNPYSIWGVGVAENMEDMQALMNGNARMAVDNIALAGNLVFDIDETSLAPGQDFKIYPGKKFLRQSGGPGQSIYGINFPNTAPAHMQMFDRWRQLADESTGIPSYSHGYTGVTGMTRTASGMSMLMQAANLNIKTAIKNIDDSLLEPLANYLFFWNMQFYKGDLDVVGDLEIKATGTQSLIQKEVKSQRLMQFLQMGSNPQIAPMINISNIVQEIANALDLDPEKVLNTTEQAKTQAQIVGMQNPQGLGGPPGMPPQIGNGGGNVGLPAQTSMPGEEQFTGDAQPERQG